DFLQRAVADVGDLAGGVLVRSPPEAGSAAGATSPFPLGFRGQVIRHSAGPGSLLQPFAEVLAVGMADVDHRMLVLQLERAGETGFAPLGAGAMLPVRFVIVGI